MDRQVTLCKCPTCNQMVEPDKISRGTYQCFHCGNYTVVWNADFDFEDYCYDGEGIVHNCHCTNCGADIEYRIRTDIVEE